MKARCAIIKHNAKLFSHPEFKDLSPYGHGGIYGLDRSTCIKAQSHGKGIYGLEEVRHG
ncbi:hypothetical protein [Acetomicrobium sp. UBA5826]|uniref:hypothetical protein n=1 Tax=Acetomicrobium sp. UBA5826 TaxID=1946039 RepID=UPI002580BDBD|nr:hypothetical protein [Acetomicrobium sp. UBA5826]